MNTYLLLRNNKESGPLSLAELTRMGLKPYDLVWVNGKSAAWRYPSEIPELKAFAPVTEEQPYDRFYKKKEDAPVEAPIKADPVVSAQPQLAETMSPVVAHSVQGNTHNAVATPAKEKKVFVAMPEKQVSGADSASPAYNHMQDKAARQETPVSHTTTTPASWEDYMPATTPKPVDDTISLEEKYSMPLDDIKEMYVKTLHDRKKKIARKHSLATIGKIAAVVVIILASGILIGSQFRKNDNKVLATIPAQEPVPASAIQNAQFVSDNYEATSNPKNGYENTREATENSLATNAGQDANNGKTESVTSSVKQSKHEENAITKNEEADTPVMENPGVKNDPVSGQRKKTMRDENNSTRENAKTVSASGQSGIENIWQEVTLTTSDFKTGPFGGIRDLFVTVNNKSAYTVDKIEVEVKYIGMEKTVVKTQLMVFNNITPGGQVRAEVPRSNRGMSVDAAINKIRVQDFSFARANK